MREGDGMKYYEAWFSLCMPKNYIIKADTQEEATKKAMELFIQQAKDDPSVFIEEWDVLERPDLQNIKVTEPEG